MSDTPKQCKRREIGLLSLFTLPRKDIQSGKFFTDAGDHRNPAKTYLAIERNTDTEFYFRLSHNYTKAFVLREDEMLCISSDGRMLTTHAESRVSLAEDNPPLRAQLFSIYCDSLKEYAKDAHVDVAGLPLFFTEPKFYSPLNVPQAQALVPETRKLRDGWKTEVKPDRVDVIVKPDIVNVDRFEFAQVKETDAVDRLYQDQLDYQKREDKKAHDETIARCQKYLSEYIPDKNTQNDHRVASERGRTVTTASEGIRGVAIYSERIAVKIASLNKHGWGATSKQEEKELREANAELQALVKAWGKRFPTLRTKQALNSLKHSETHNLNKKLKLENTEL